MHDTLRYIPGWMFGQCMARSKTETERLRMCVAKNVYDNDNERFYVRKE